MHERHEVPTWKRITATGVILATGSLTLAACGGNGNKPKPVVQHFGDLSFTYNKGGTVTIDEYGEGLVGMEVCQGTALVVDSYDYGSDVQLTPNSPVCADGKLTLSDFALTSASPSATPSN